MALSVVRLPPGTVMLLHMLSWAVARHEPDACLAVQTTELPSVPNDCALSSSRHRSSHVTALCLQALKRFTILQHVAAAAMAACGLVGSAAYGAGLRFPDARLIGLAAGAALFALAYKKVKDIRQLFIFKDYRHPDHN